MITGLHFDIPSTKLKDLLLKKAKYHLGRMETYRKQITAWQEQNITFQGKMSSIDPRDDFQRKVRSHERSAKEATFQAEFLVPDEVYRLSEREVDKLLVDSDDDF